MLTFTEYSRQHDRAGIRSRVAGYRREIVDRELRFVQHASLRKEVAEVERQLNDLVRERGGPTAADIDDAAERLSSLATRELLIEADLDRRIGRFHDPFDLLGDAESATYLWPAATTRRRRGQPRTTVDLLALDLLEREPSDFNKPAIRNGMHAAVHVIWMGGPFTRDRGHDAVRSWSTVGKVPLRFLWTDLDRRALADGSAKIEEMRKFCTDNRVTVLCIDEVFDARRPMKLQSQFNFLRLQREWAAASDILRYELLHRFGGAYADTDVTCVGPVHWRDVKAHPFHSDHRFAMGSMEDQTPTPAALFSTPRNPILDEVLAFVEEAYRRTTAAVLRYTPQPRSTPEEFPYTRRRIDETLARTGPTAFSVALLRHCFGTEPVGNQTRIQHVFPDAVVADEDAGLSTEEIYGVYSDAILRDLASGQGAWIPRSIPSGPGQRRRRRRPQNPRADDAIEATREFFAGVAIGSSVLDIRPAASWISVRRIPSMSLDDAKVALTNLLFRLANDPSVLDLIPYEDIGAGSRAGHLVDVVRHGFPDALDTVDTALIAYRPRHAATDAGGREPDHGRSTRTALTGIGFAGPVSRRDDFLARSTAGEQSGDPTTARLATGFALGDDVLGEVSVVRRVAW